MNTIQTKNYLLIPVLFAFFCMIIASCEQKNKESKEPQQAEQTEEIAVNTKVSEQVLTQIAESNLKIVAIAQKAQEGKMSKQTRTILEEIEKNHLQLKNKIRKIAKDNFIIIPNTLYDTSTIKNFIDEMSTKLYLKKLENSLLLELELYTSINATTQNKDLKTLTQAVIPNIKKDISIIKEEEKQLQ